MQILHEVLPSPLLSDESNAGFFVWLDSSEPELVNTRLTPLPTTPRCVTPEDPFVCAVETVGESKPPLLFAVPICEEFITAGDALFSLTLDLRAAIPRISERIDFGFRATCWRSSSCKAKDGWCTQDEVTYAHFQILTHTKNLPSSLAHHRGQWVFQSLLLFLSQNYQTQKHWCLHPDLAQKQ